MSTAGHRVRVTVDRMNYSACGLKVGDYFEVQGSKLSMPAEQKFCYFAIGAAIPLLESMKPGMDPESWLARKPYICCPDPAELVVMKLSVLPAEHAIAPGLAPEPAAIPNGETE